MSTIEYDVGMIGDGQLARMNTQAAHNLGYSVGVISESIYSPAAMVGAEIVRGNMQDERAILELARLSAVMTLEAEHINGDAYATAEQIYGNTQPKPITLLTISDKLKQKQLLASKGIPVAPFSGRLDEVDFPTVPDYESEQDMRFVVKTRKGGFDGRGNMSVASLDDPSIAGRFKSAVYVEQMVPFDKELSVVVARDMHGNVVPYPVVETIHKDHICHTVISPAPINPEVAAKAELIAVEAVRHFSGAGVFAVEMFLVGDEVIVNEIAPRVHNSGHLTIEANETSQFTQHILAVTGESLGRTQLVAPAAIMVNILHAFDADGMKKAESQVPDIYFHLYDKEPREGQPRKIGHYTILANDIEIALEYVARVERLLKIA